MFIDTHCHLTFPQFNTDQAMVMGNAKKAGVKQFVNPGVDYTSSYLSVQLAQKYSGVVFAAVGFHPYEAQKVQDANSLESFIQQCNAEGPKQCIVAVGECGLDYHMYKGEVAEGKKDVQKRLFEEQLLLSLKHNLPVIIHCRDAWDDVFNVLDNLPSMPSGVFHCFSGGLQEIRMAKARNFLVGVDGNVTYSKFLETTVPNIPLEMIVLETDAPYLTPDPYRGTRNEPKYIPRIASKVALLHHVDPKTVEEVTTRNAKQLFGLP